MLWARDLDFQYIFMRYIDVHCSGSTPRLQGKSNDCEGERGTSGKVHRVRGRVWNSGKVEGVRDRVCVTLGKSIECEGECGTLEK